MSRADEIKEKLALQAKIQGSFQNDTAKVMSWLSDKKEESDGGISVEQLNESKQQFFQLPVVQAGSGLSFQTEAAATMSGSNSADIHTIGEFINSDKKVSSLAKKKKRRDNAATEPRDSIHRISKNDTKAMVALKHKMRKGTREEIRKNISKEEKNMSSDEEDEPRVEIKKKSFGLLFDGKKKK
ncbi:hypothetical protein RNJ44_02500 [Nakaseomyces bracarensis]|uniref:Nucleolar protein 19 n=1 Tax=Nakaseomyces bracarensis TaxID=273131 RepID=A0ABR4NLV3_9SACH